MRPSLVDGAWWLLAVKRLIYEELISGPLRGIVLESDIRGTEKPDSYMDVGWDGATEVSGKAFVLKS